MGSNKQFSEVKLITPLLYLFYITNTLVISNFHYCIKIILFWSINEICVSYQISNSGRFLRRDKVN